MRAAQGTGVKVIKRKVFLDDSQNEADIRVQFNRAIDLARRNGSTIAIGHPHPSTVRVLQQMVYNLPPDITLVKASSLLNEPQVDTSTPPKNTVPDAPRNPFRGVKLCKPKKPLEPVYADRFFSVLSESISQSTLVNYIRNQWQGWGGHPPIPQTLIQIKRFACILLVRQCFVAPLPQTQRPQQYLITDLSAAHISYHAFIHAGSKNFGNHALTGNKIGFFSYCMANT